MKCVKLLYQRISNYTEWLKIDRFMLTEIGKIQSKCPLYNRNQQLQSKSSSIDRHRFRYRFRSFAWINMMSFLFFCLFYLSWLFCVCVSCVRSFAWHFHNKIWLWVYIAYIWLIGHKSITGIYLYIVQPTTIYNRAHLSMGILTDRLHQETMKFQS